MSEALVRINGVSLKFSISGDILEQLSIKRGRLHRRREYVHALNDVSIDIHRAESLCVVGESGCGKSTLARVIMGLLKPSQGEIHYENHRIDTLNHKKRFPFKKKMQMIFQNPYASLNPRMRVREALTEPLHFHRPNLSKSEVQDKVNEIMKSVGIDPSWGQRFPHEFSGGQRQRVSIARALTVDPEFIIADEPISALDVSIQAQVLNLLLEAQKERSLTYLFITHDLSVVEHFGSQVAVMYLGRICEYAKTKTLFQTPKHPYTRALLSAIPSLKKKKQKFIRLNGEVSSPIDLPSGCVFHRRCPYVNERCRNEIPALISTKDGSSVACHAIEEQRLD